MVARVATVGANTGGGNVISFTIAWPSGIAAGDVALCAWVMQSTATPSIPSGWNAPGAFDGPGSSRHRLLWHPCDGTETGTLSLGDSNAITNRQSAALVIYRGLDPAAPIDGTPQYLAETVSQTTHACPSVTPGVADAVILTTAAERSSSGTTSWTAPAGYTKRADSATAATGSGGTIVAVADDGLGILRPAGTAVTPPAWTSGNAFASNNVTTCTIALVPLPHSGWGAPI